MELYFFHFIEAIFVGTRRIFTNIILSETWKLCRSEAIRLRLVETEVWYCQDYLAGTNLEKRFRDGLG